MCKQRPREQRTRRLINDATESGRASALTIRCGEQEGKRTKCEPLTGRAVQHADTTSQLQKHRRMGDFASNTTRRKTTDPLSFLPSSSPPPSSSFCLSFFLSLSLSLLSLSLSVCLFLFLSFSLSLCRSHSASSTSWPATSSPRRCCGRSETRDTK